MPVVCCYMSTQERIKWLMGQPACLELTHNWYAGLGC